MSIEIVMTEYITRIDIYKEYSLEELTKILSDTYKAAYKVKKDRDIKEKKAADEITAILEKYDLCDENVLEQTISEFCLRRRQEYDNDCDEDKVNIVDSRETKKEVTTEVYTEYHDGCSCDDCQKRL
jgi:uncharacterized protein with PIN domain